jgi:hypothetical protein
VSTGDVIASDKDGKKPVVSPIDGVVEFGDDEAMISPSDKPFVRYEIPGFKTLVVTEGDVIEAGDRITAGSINLQELMRLKGVEATQRYIMNDVLKMFASQGQTIADKHLEVVIRQMFSRVSIEDSGDTTFVTGDVVSLAAVEEANKEMVEAGKEPAVLQPVTTGNYQGFNLVRLVPVSCIIPRHNPCFDQCRNVWQSRPPVRSKGKRNPRSTYSCRYRSTIRRRRIRTGVDSRGDICLNNQVLLRTICQQSTN